MHKACSVGEHEVMLHSQADILQSSLNCSVMPWQFGQLGLTESGGNRLIKYADMILDGVRLLRRVAETNSMLTSLYFLIIFQASPNDGLAIYANETSIDSIFVYEYLSRFSLKAY